MDDLSIFLSRHPHLSPDVLRRVELFRASVELEMRQTVERVRTPKLGYAGENVGWRLSRDAVREIEDGAIANCCKLFEIVGREFQQVSGIPGDLTAFFEDLAGSIVVEAHRLYRNSTASVWFERVPSLKDVRLHEELGDKRPYDQIADYLDPEPSSIRVDEVLISRIEPLREKFTTGAMQQRVEDLESEIIIPDLPADSLQRIAAARRDAELRIKQDFARSPEIYELEPYLGAVKVFACALFDAEAGELLALSNDSRTLAKAFKQLETRVIEGILPDRDLARIPERSTESAVTIRRDVHGLVEERGTDGVFRPAGARRVALEARHGDWENLAPDHVWHLFRLAPAKKQTVRKVLSQALQMRAFYWIGRLRSTKQPAPKSTARSDSGTIEKPISHELPRLTEIDPKRILTEESRRRIYDAGWKAQVLRRRTLADLELLYTSQAERKESFSVFLTTGQPAVKFGQSLLEEARLVLAATRTEYKAAGVIGLELDNIMLEEIEGAVNSLELSRIQRQLLEVEFTSNPLGIDTTRLEGHGNRTHAEPASASADELSALAGWHQLEISFLSEERVQINIGSKTETLNYAEFGFMDARTQKPNRAWQVMRELAQRDGTIPSGSKGFKWPNLEKRIQEIRMRLRKRFSHGEDPIPFVPGTGYRAQFRVRCSASFET
jgi:hypothetical protein